MHAQAKEVKEETRKVTQKLKGERVDRIWGDVELLLGDADYATDARNSRACAQVCSANLFFSMNRMSLSS